MKSSLDLEKKVINLYKDYKINSLKKLVVAASLIYSSNVQAINLEEIYQVDKCGFYIEQNLECPNQSKRIPFVDKNKCYDLECINNNFSNEDFLQERKYLGKSGRGCRVDVRCNENEDCPSNWECLRHISLNENRCFNPDCDYCGPGSNLHNIPNLDLTIKVSDCLNKSCFIHDACYDKNCVGDCSWSPASKSLTPCDRNLYLSCGECFPHTPLTFASSIFVCSIISDFYYLDFNLTDCETLCSSNERCDNHNMWQSICVENLPTSTPTINPTNTKTPTKTSTPTPVISSDKVILEIGSTTGHKGESVYFDVNLNINPRIHKINSLETNLSYNSLTPINTFGYTADCIANPSFERSDFFAYPKNHFINNCISKDNCLTALLSYPSNSSIPNSMKLYSCKINILPQANSGSYPLVCDHSNFFALEGPNLDYECRSGEVIVLDSINTPTLTKTRTPTNTIAKTPTRTLTPPKTYSRTPTKTFTPTRTKTRTPFPISTRTKTPTRTSQIVSGDCNRNNSISIDEILKAVNISLRNINLSVCPESDINKDKKVSIDELIKIVNLSLNRR